MVCMTSPDSLVFFFLFFFVFPLAISPDCWGRTPDSLLAVCGREDGAGSGDELREQAARDVPLADSRTIVTEGTTLLSVGQTSFDNSAQSVTGYPGILAMRIISSAGHPVGTGSCAARPRRYPVAVSEWREQWSRNTATVRPRNFKWSMDKGLNDMTGEGGYPRTPVLLLSLVGIASRSAGVFVIKFLPYHILRTVFSRRTCFQPHDQAVVWASNSNIRKLATNSFRLVRIRMS
ncbi:hypothetical protein BC827DRAFT_417179 [Russula dissimulans]|nr:hypothetical protein BC827DRAFT_417179 [Russula dissimulans]